MTTAARGSTDDEEIRPLEPVEEKPSFAETPLARWLFLGLAAVASLAFLAAIVIVVTAPANTVTLLTIALSVLVVVVLAEIVLLLVARPRKA